MSEEAGPTNQKRSRCFTRRLLVTMVLATIWAGPASADLDPKEVEAKAALAGMVMAVKGYFTEYNRWPVTEALFSVLKGDNIAGRNPRRIRFYNPPGKTLPNDTPVDPWGQGYVFDGIMEGVPHFHSRGKDGVDQKGAEGSDDVVSWR